MSLIRTNRLLTVPEAAQRLNVSERWVRRAVFERRFPVVKLGRLVRIAEADLEAFVGANRCESQRGEVAPLVRLRRNA